MKEYPFDFLIPLSNFKNFIMKIFNTKDAYNCIFLQERISLIADQR